MEQVLDNYKGDTNVENESRYCNLMLLSQSLDACLLDGEDIHLGHYLDTYKELTKFCTLLGSVFGFVASELESKTSVLKKFRDKDECGNFMTLKNMINYEKHAGLLDDKKYISGCRTILLLNRGLDFLRTFLQRVHELQPNEGTSSVGKEVYADTLGNYHVWYVRMGAYLAMSTMPSKQGLIDQVFGESQGCMLKFLPQVLNGANKVYNLTFNTLKNHNLLRLK